MWFVANKNNNSINKPKSLTVPLGCLSLVGTTNLRIPTIIFLVCWILQCFFQTNWRVQSAVFVKYVICGVLKGKHKYFCLRLLIYLNMLKPPPLFSALRWTLEVLWFLPGVLYYHLSLFSVHTINSLCQIGFSTFLSFLRGYTSPLESHSWKKWKPTDYLW